MRDTIIRLTSWFLAGAAAALVIGFGALLPKCEGSGPHPYTTRAAVTTIPRDPWPRQFFLLLGTGEPRLTFRPPYTAYNCRSLFYPPDNAWYLTCTPQLYVYPTPSGQLPRGLATAGVPAP